MFVAAALPETFLTPAFGFDAGPWYVSVKAKERLPTFIVAAAVAALRVTWLPMLADRTSAMSIVRFIFDSFLFSVVLFLCIVLSFVRYAPTLGASVPDVLHWRNTGVNPFHHFFLFISVLFVNDFIQCAPLGAPHLSPFTRMPGGRQLLSLLFFAFFTALYSSLSDPIPCPEPMFRAKSYYSKPAASIPLADFFALSCLGHQPCPAHRFISKQYSGHFFQIGQIRPRKVLPVPTGIASPCPNLARTSGSACGTLALVRLRRLHPCFQGAEVNFGSRLLFCIFGQIHGLPGKGKALVFPPLLEKQEPARHEQLRGVRRRQRLRPVERLPGQHKVTVGIPDIGNDAIGQGTQRDRVVVVRSASNFWPNSLALGSPRSVSIR